MNFENFKQDKKLAICTISSLVGFSFNFLGICIAQGGQPFSAFNPYGLQWYFMFWYLLWIGLMAMSQMTATIHLHKSLLLAWTTLTLAFLPLDIERSLSAAHSRVSPFGNGLKIAGSIMLFASIFPALVFLGIDQESPIYSYDLKVPSFPMKAKKEEEKPYQVPQTFVPPEPFVPSLDRAPKSEVPIDTRVSNQVAQFPDPNVSQPRAVPMAMTTSPEPMNEVQAKAIYPCM
jgi:hypothetical protein